LKYDDLVENPQDTVLKVYKHFDWNASEDFVKTLQAEQLRQKNYQSAHEYSLEKFNLSKDYIYESLFEVFHEFGFER
jgi:hypothetical protein